MDTDLKPGGLLGGRYVLLEELGRGGMGIVFKARQELLDRQVAIKVISEPATRGSVTYARFQREAKLASSLNHPNIVTIHDFGFTDQQFPYLVMEYIDGPSMGSVIAKCSPLNIYDVVVWFINVCDALSYAHAKGVIHRDLKPDNIMLARDETGREHVRVVDFGLAKLFDDDKPADHNLTTVGTILGTPVFMSPEQCLAKDLDHRSDIYSLGCVLFAALTGRVPIKGQTLQETLIMQVMAEPLSLAEVAPNQNFPAQLQKVISQALSKAPGERQQSCDQMRSQLIGILQALPTGSQFDAQDNTRSVALHIDAAQSDFATVQSKALAGDPEAQNLLGEYYQYGGPVEISLRNAQVWYEKAAQKGHPIAQYNLGWLLQFGGDGIAIDPEKGFKWLKRSAEAGFPPAKVHCGRCLMSGAGTDVNRQEAVKWLNEALHDDKDSCNAMYLLAFCYDAGWAVEKDAKRAFSLWQQAAQGGHPRAQFEVARCFEDGYGVKQDLDAARHWFEQAADQGVADAYQKLNDMAKAGNSGLAPEVAELSSFLSQVEKINKLVNLGKKSEALALAQSIISAAERFIINVFNKPETINALPPEIAGLIKKGHADALCEFLRQELEEDTQGLENIKSLLNIRDNVIRIVKGLSSQPGNDIASGEHSSLNSIDFDPMISREDIEQVSDSEDDYEDSYQQGMQLRYGSNPDFESAAEKFRYAADGGKHALANLEYGRCCEFGVGLPGVDLPNAVLWYCCAYYFGHEEAIEELLRCLDSFIEAGNTPEFLLEWLEGECVAEVPNVAAMIALGRILETDNPRGQNFAESLRLYRQAAKAKCRGGMYLTGRLLILNYLEEADFERLSASLPAYERGLTGWSSYNMTDARRKEERKEGFKIAQQAADEGFTPALLFLSGLYCRGIGIGADTKKALSMLTKAAELEDLRAQAILGTVLVEGIAGTKNAKEGCGWLKQASQAGDPFAQWNLAQCLLEGTGIEVDRPKAKTLLEEAASKNFQQDDRWSHDTFAARFGRLITLFGDLSQRGQREAQYWLGVCLEHGVGVERDRDRSLEQYYMSSERGYPPAEKAFNEAPRNMQSLVKRKMAKGKEGATSS